MILSEHLAKPLVGLVGEEAVWGASSSSNTTGVLGSDFDSSGVSGLASTTGFNGVFGRAAVAGAVALRAIHSLGGGTIGGGVALAVSGDSNFNSGDVNVVGDVDIDGTLNVTGTKNFVHPHPTDPSLEVVFVALEGPEANTIFRGTANLVNGEARIVPDESWRLTTAETGITAFVTPRGPAAVWVESESLDLIVIRGTADVPINYFVIGLRAGFEYREVIQLNTHIVPTYRGEPYASDQPVSYQQLLIENGTLNSDLTLNEATAARLGWELQDRSAEMLTPLGAGVGDSDAQPSRYGSQRDPGGGR